MDGRVADMDDTLPDGFKLKKGDGVYYISYAMGRMAHIWGDDAYDFKPERWLNDNGVFQPESPFKFIAFHVSKCLWLFIFTLVFDFEVKFTKSQLIHIAMAILMNFFKYDKM
ncbi:putative abieta-7,13-dien-18-ol hydroxylase [Helianthus debilis subsp. tardiflorus]